MLENQTAIVSNQECPVDILLTYGSNLYHSPNIKKKTNVK